jgi:hypothetical protein
MSDNGHNSPACAICGEIHSDKAYLHARCHLDGPVQVMIVNRRAVRVECGTCGREVLTLQLAKDLFR